uniref:Glycosyltransferase family 92 protein n=1 Tax=Steinernema glaseri TaxID=37863 RepID=A0A1I7Y3E9_9BILA
MSAMKNESIYDEDVNNALDGMKYMKDLTRGTAYIAPVVAKPQRITEHNGCAKLQVLQVVEMGWIRAENIHLFSAYYDKRLNSMFPRQHVVQVLAMHYRTLEEKLYCTLQSPYTSVVVRAGIREIWQRAWDPRDHFYIPYLISCPVPKRLRNDADIMVTVSTKRCVTGKVSALKVQLNNKNDMKGKIAVCVKGLDFLEDKNYSNHFVEWMELQLLLGADSVTVYTYSVTEEMFQILDFYEKRRKLNHIRLTLSGESPNVALTRSSFIWRNRQQKRRHELIPYNDCLYRHINSHEYLLIVDTDEVVIPLKHASWGQMIASELSTNLTDKWQLLHVGKSKEIGEVTGQKGLRQKLRQNEKRSYCIQPLFTPPTA